jgi:hypothetical protein
MDEYIAPAMTQVTDGEDEYLKSAVNLTMIVGFIFLFFPPPVDPEDPGT